MLNREQIEFCIDEGVCCHCGQTIRWGHDAVYTINGAHYDCQFPDGRPATSIGKLSMAIFGKDDCNSSPRFGEADQPTLARANGGHVLHWVVPCTGVALCGHKPKNNSWRMKARGRWLVAQAGSAAGRRRICGGCASKNSKAPETESGN